MASESRIRAATGRQLPRSTPGFDFFAGADRSVDARGPAARR
ncbi:hypothetical protein [Natronosalvus vescus]|nr:hypothetical protein [Natronosalvus vescus]